MIRSGHLGNVWGFWSRYRQNSLAVIGLALVLVNVVLAFLANVIAPKGPFYIVASLALHSPNLSNVMGANNLGMDVFGQIVYGLRTSFYIGIVAAITSLAVGSILGAFAGYYGGKLDTLLMRITELFQIIPTFVLAILIVAIFGQTIQNITLTIGILSWPATMRLVRAEFLTLKEREFVEATRSLGASNLRLMFGEIFPNSAYVIIANSSLEVGKAILLASGLGFLGLGDPNVAELGSILGNAQSYVFLAWWMAVFPGLILASLTMGMALIGDGLNEAFRSGG